MDILSTYLPIDRIHALARGETLPDRAHGSALFADISGFTPLTEALARELGPRRGAEELTHVLNQVYDALIAEIDRYGGGVIGFSGDAVTVWFDDTRDKNSPFRAVACALALQATIKTFAALPLSNGAFAALALKVAVASGAARRFIIGDPQLQRLDTLVGSTVARMASAEQVARAGEIVIDAATVAALDDAVHITEWRTHADEPFALVAALNRAVAPAPWPPLIQSLSAEQLRPWVLPATYERHQAGLGEFLTELRLAVALFLRFEGIDYDGDAAAGDKLDVFMRHVQHTLAKYEGALIHLTIGDKGSYLHAVFGAPIAHEDDARRALYAALELRALPAQLDFMGALQIGIARGGMRSGTYGGTTRRTYGVMGDDVNLAARLMQVAAPGEVFATGRVRNAAGDALEWETLPALQLKGKIDPIPVYRLIGQSHRRSVSTRPKATHIVGRVSERERLLARVEGLLQGQSSLCIIEGEAGIGKSRLVEDLIEQASARAVTVALGAGDAIEKSTPYHAWRAVFSQLLRWDALPADAQTRRAQISAQLPNAERAPLLNAVLPLGFADNELTAQLSGEVRAANTHELLLALLQQAAQTPLLLILDDTHWLDSASWALALAASRVQPLLFVIVTRPLPEPWPDEYTRLRAQTNTLRLPLEPLAGEEALTLVCQRLGVSELPEAVATLIREKAEGHPFFSEEIAYALRDSGVIVIENGVCYIAPGLNFSHIKTPDTVEGVIISRIDRLTPSPQLTIKVASVIGRVFAFRLLRDVHPIDADRLQLADDLAALQRLDLTPLDTPEPNLAYIFKHIITREVSYNLMTFEQRRELHRAVGVWYEHEYAGNLSPHYATLAYHWSNTANRPKTIEYLVKASEHALANYANQEAVSFLSEALRLAADAQVAAPQRAHWEQQLGEAYLKLGQHADSRKHSERALNLLGRPLPGSRGRRVLSLLVQLARQVGLRVMQTRAHKRVAAPDRLVIARAYFVIGELCYYDNNWVLGLALMLGIVNLIEADGASPELANAYAGLSLVAAHLGRSRLVELYSHMAQETARRTGKLETEAFALQVTSAARLRLGHWAESQRAGDQALAMFARLGDRRRWEECISYLSEIAIVHGEFAHAIELNREATHSAHQRNDFNSALVALAEVASLQLVLGQTTRARADIDAAFNMLEQAPDSGFEKFACARLTQVHLRQGEWQLATQTLERGRRLAHAGSSELISGVGASALALAALELWQARGQLENERQALAQFVKQSLIEARGDTRLIAQPQMWRLRGWEAWLSGKPHRALRMWRKSLAVAEKLRIPYEAALAHVELGRHVEDKERQMHLQMALGVFERLGALYDAEQARYIDSG